MIDCKNNRVNLASEVKVDVPNKNHFFNKPRIVNLEN